MDALRDVLGEVIPNFVCIFVLPPLMHAAWTKLKETW